MAKSLTNNQVKLVFDSRTTSNDTERKNLTKDSGDVIFDTNSKSIFARGEQFGKAPSLQTTWQDGDENTYIYSKKWINGGANDDKVVLSAKTTLAQSGGQMKFRYFFWGAGNNGMIWGPALPVATTTADGFMSSTDKSNLETVKSNLETLQTDFAPIKTDFDTVRLNYAQLAQYIGSLDEFIGDNWDSGTLDKVLEPQRYWIDIV